jgi:hypothetical protein
MSSNALSIISAVTQEIMTISGVAGGATVAHLFSSYQASRERAGREILLKRLAEAEIDAYEAASEDELVGVAYSYMLCASKGTARVTLDLLAQAIAGEMKGGGIYPDKFHKYINVLSSLTKDEILVIGTYIRCYDEYSAKAKEAREVNRNFPTDIKHGAWSQMMYELSPSSFPTREHISVILGSLIRTGLTTAMPPQLGNSADHSFTVLLDEISKLINFEKAYGDYPKY